MLKIQKYICLSLIFLSLIVTYSSISNNQQKNTLPIVLPMLDNCPLIGPYISIFIYWVSVLLFIILLFLFLSIYLYPGNKNTFSNLITPTNNMQNMSKKELK